MTFTCTKENLLRALQLTAGSTIRPGNLPILANVLIRATESGVELVSTNLELAISANLRAKVDAAAEFTVPAKTLMDYVTLLQDEQVHVSLSGNELVVKCGSASSKIKGTPADEFPVIPTIEDGDTYLIDSTVLKEALSQVVFAAAKNDIRPELAGVYFGFFVGDTQGLTLAATDSYRLAERTVALAKKQPERRCIVPGRAAMEFVRLLGLLSASSEADTPVRLVVSESQIALVHDACEMSSRLIDGNYPDYQQIIPSAFQSTATFSQSIAVKEVKAASLFSTSGVNAVKLTLDPKQKHLAVSSTSSQTGAHDAAIDAEVIGEEGSIVLNHRYILDGLQHIADGDVEFKMNGSDAPCLMKSTQSDDYLYIVMPIRQ